MATYDSADLLARFKLYARFPTQGTAPLTDAQCYILLSEAQEALYAEIATFAPHVLYGAPTLLTSSDSGVTYAFGNDGDGVAYVPYAVEVYAKANGRELFGASYDNTGGDFVFEATKLRTPGNQTRTYDAGPYVRMILPPAPITASTAPTLMPKEARKLIVFKAVEKWAQVGGLIDPTPARELYEDAWLGPVQSGGYRSGGLRDALRLQYTAGMTPATEGMGSGVWWRGLVASR